MPNKSPFMTLYMMTIVMTIVMTICDNLRDTCNRNVRDHDLTVKMGHGQGSIEAHYIIFYIR